MPSNQRPVTPPAAAAEAPAPSPSLRGIVEPGLAPNVTEESVAETIARARGDRFVRIKDLWPEASPTPQPGKKR